LADVWSRLDHARVPVPGCDLLLAVRAGGKLHKISPGHMSRPLPRAPKIEKLISFFNEHVDVDVDGEGREPPWDAMVRQPKPGLLPF